MKYIIIFLMLLTVMAGCSRYIESDDLKLELSDPPPIPVDLRISHFNESLQITWQVSDTDAVNHFRIYYGTDSDINFMYLWDTTSLFVEVIDNIVSGQLYYIQVSAVAGGVEGERSDLYQTTPGVLDMTINSNDEYTSSRDISVSFIIPTSASLVMISESSAFDDAVWENYSATKSFELSEGDGLKEIFAQLRFADGTASAGNLSDEIILDSRADVDSVYFIPNNQVLHARETVTFYLKTGETGGDASVSFPGRSDLELFDDGTRGDVTADDGLFTRNFVIPLDLEVADGIVEGTYRDEAGNSSGDDLVASTYLTIANSPSASTLAANLVTDNDGNRSISLSWTICPDNDFATYRLYKDTFPGIVQNEEDLIIWITETQGETEYQDINPANGTYYYRVFVYDDQGLATPSNEVSIRVP